MKIYAKELGFITKARKRGFWQARNLYPYKLLELISNSQGMTSKFGWMQMRCSSKKSE